MKKWNIQKQNKEQNLLLLGHFLFPDSIAKDKVTKQKHHKKCLL